ncbi:MAG: glycosyltransferase family 2 protein [Ktedonobacteraceae bacterium]
MLIVATLLGVFAALLLIPSMTLFVEVVSAVLYRPRASTLPDVPRPAVAILMAAHNEAFGIAETLRSISGQLTAADRLVVVADNCTDATAAIAAAEGAVVIVRADLERRGKGYALDMGVRYLQSHKPEIVVVVDADCHFTDGSIDTLARVCAVTSRPIQALYRIYAPSPKTSMMRIAEFAARVKNQIRPIGLSRFALPCQLMGTGMAFPWEILAAAPLASGNIVEDLQLGIDLALAGTPPIFCPDAVVASAFPPSEEGADTQRRRWEHGHLNTLLHEAPALLYQAISDLDVKALSLALDISIPPLALLVILLLCVESASILVYASSYLLWPTVIASVACVLVLLSVLMSWWRQGRDLVSLMDLAVALLSIFRKLPLYGRFLIQRQTEWNRTRRD